MYNPRPHHVRDDEAIRAFVAQAGAGTLVTSAGGRVEATLLPMLWTEEGVVAHFARANPHAAQIGSGADGLWIVHGPQAYVSPGWYASKQEHGRVVPTWNYSVVQLRGRVQVHDDPAWLRAFVGQLTDAQERGRAEPWAVGDAPEEFVEQQLRGIVGVQMAVESVEAKAKWSQNRSDSDKAGVVRGLRDAGDFTAAEHMAEVLAARPAAPERTS